MVKGGVFVTTRYLDKESWQVLRRLLMPANALVLEVMLYTGLRVSDVLMLRTSELSNYFTISECKTVKPREVALSDELLQKLRAQASDPWVFASPMYPSQPRTRQAVWADIKRAAKAMRIPLVIAPHSARKSYACELYKETRSIEQVREALNHDRITTTAIYLMDVFLPPE